MADEGSGATCRAEIDAAGFPGRTDRILARERGAFEQHAAVLQGRAGQEPRGGEAPPLTVGQIADGFASDDRQAQRAAAFVAGRCRGGDASAQERIADTLRELAGVDLEPRDTRALLAVDAAMSLVLLGDEDTGRAALSALVGDDAPGTMADPIAAHYLAQLGDLSGWPAMVRLLADPDGFTRLLTARHLVAFLPFCGEEVGGVLIDVVERMRPLLDDKDDITAAEIPWLLVEIGDDRVRDLLARAAKKARHKKVREAARRALEAL